MGCRAHGRAAAIQDQRVILTDLQAALECALRAAALARDILLAECARPGGPRGEIGKCPADDEAEQAIREVLLSAYPRWGFLGEETGGVEQEPGEGYVWFVDPNDGTSSMQRGYRGHAVSIGLVRDGLPVLGVVWAVDAPDDDGDLVCWAEGCGPIQRNGMPLSFPAWPSRLRSDDMVGVSQGANRNPVGYAAKVAPARFMGAPSIAHRLALVACGDHVATLSLNQLEAWDFAAGHALVRGAHGVLVAPGGESISYPAHGPGQPTRVFAGAPQVVRHLRLQHWDDVSRSGFGEAAPPPELYPIRPVPGRLVHDSGVLSRAQGCLLGQLAGDFQTGQAGPDAEQALMLARRLVVENVVPSESSNRALPTWVGPLGVWGAFRPPDEVARAVPEPTAALLAVTLAAVIREGLDPAATLSFARSWATAHQLEAPVLGPLENALLQLLDGQSFDDSLSGALLGAIHGRDVIPPRLRQQILSSRPANRPAVFWPTDALVLAERLLTTTGPRRSLS